MRILEPKITSVEYEVRSNYGEGYEMTYASEDIADILARLKEYRENEPEYLHRAVIIRHYRQTRILKSGEVKHKDYSITAVLRRGRDYDVNYLPINK